MNDTVARTSHTAALALEYADRLVVAAARDLHGAVASRVFGSTRFIAGPVPAKIHDLISTAVYDCVSAGVRGSSAAVGALAAQGLGRPIEDDVRGRKVVAVVNAFVGSELSERDDPQTIAMSVRHGSVDVRCEPGSIGRAFEGARSEIVVLVHGLAENDDSWGPRSDRDDGTYASRIVADTAATPVLIRYNSGLHVSDNGAALDRLLTDLVAAWPLPVTGIHLVGHSMGGLVVRAATNHAVVRGAAWPAQVANIVCLGTPHLGASLEKIVHVGARALRLVPEAAPFARILDVRSPGIVDLRHGYISRDEWHGQDLSSRWGLDRIAAAPLAHADYHFVAATLGPSRRHVVSEILGDLLVRFPSAAGRGRRGEPVVAHAQVEHIARTDHFALLNHPRVADWLVRWVNGAPRALT